jgi:hypothetical protein
MILNEGGGFPNLSAEGRHIMDHVIGREECHEGVRLERARDRGGKGGGGSGVALGRFGDDVLPRQEGEGGDRGLQLNLVGENEDPLGGDDSLKPAGGLLEQGLVAEKLDQMLRCGGAADGPEAFPAATRHDEEIKAVERG